MKKIKNRLIYHKLLILGLITLSNSNAAAEIKPQLPESGIISLVSDNLTLSIKDSAAHLELASIYVPPNLLNDSVKKLKELAEGKEFKFSYINNKANRYGNFSVIATENEKSLQESLIENGLAFVYFTDSNKNTESLFIAEEKARLANTGIWSNSRRTRNSNSITNSYKTHLSKFIIIDGQVKNIYSSKKNTYINFGEDWKTDFSVQLENSLLKYFPEFNINQLSGKHVRVRGWLENYNGPFMKIFNPANVEIIKE